MSTKLRSLTIQGCRSIAEPLTLEFPERGLLLLRGINHATGGSSGSGKSSFLNALAYVSGFCSIPATELQNWETDALPLMVKAELANDDILCTISRGNKNYVDVTGEKTTRGSIAAVNERFNNFIGLTPDLLEALTYRRQDSGSFFLSLDDEGKKELLTAVLDLKKFEDAADEAAKKATDLRRRADALAGAANTSKKVHDDILVPIFEEKSCKELHDRLNALDLESRPIGAEMDRLAEHINLLGTELARARMSRPASTVDKDIELVQQAIRTEQEVPVVVDIIKGPTEEHLKKVDERLQTLRAADKAAQAAVQQRVMSLRLAIGKKRDFVQTEDQWKKKLEEAEAQLVEAQNHTCWNCKQTWAHADTKSITNAIAEARRQLALIATAEEELIADYDQLKLEVFRPNDKIPGLEKTRENIMGVIAGEKATMAERRKVLEAEKAGRIAELNARLSKLQAVRTEETSLVVNEIQDDQAAAMMERNKLSLRYNEIGHSMASLQRSIDTIGAENFAGRKAHLDAAARKEKARGDFEKAQAEYEKVKLEFDTETVLAKLLGREGFLGVIFDEVLQEMAGEANDILGSVPNTSNTRVDFRSETMTLRGTPKRTIVATAVIDGHTCSLKNGPSGGMGTAIKLAVDLALGRVIERRTGVTPGWLVLDEPFNGLGAREKEACLEILSIHAQDKLVIVVDHATETQELFQKVVDLHFRDGRTTLE